jgi:hypothetical protein
MVRDAKVAGLPEHYILNLPHMLRNAKAVLLDKRDGNLLFVFDVPGNPKKGKFVIQLNIASKRRTLSGNQQVTTNSVRSGGLVDEASLRDEHFYERLTGAM